VGLFPWSCLGVALLLYQTFSVGHEVFRCSWIQGGPTLYSCALGIIMLSMGLTIRWEDLRDLVLGQPAAIAFGFAAQYAVMPLLGLLVSRALELPPPLAAGLVLLSCCPGGTASNVVSRAEAWQPVRKMLVHKGDSLLMVIC
jgi:predicted Na+-dependent transporter